jgi:hypothetical protein
VERGEETSFFQKAVLKARAIGAGEGRETHELTRFYVFGRRVGARDT